MQYAYADSPTRSGALSWCGPMGIHPDSPDCLCGDPTNMYAREAAVIGAAFFAFIKTFILAPFRRESSDSCTMKFLVIFVTILMIICASAVVGLFVEGACFFIVQRMFARFDRKCLLPKGPCTSAHFALPHSATHCEIYRALACRILYEIAKASMMGLP